VRRAAVAAALLAGVLAAGCGPKLPEPETRAAQLYVKYCSGSGCHGPIPPQRDIARYWDLQTDRMLVLMREQGWALPTPEEDREIRAYLHKHAAR
jgi:hypothetical protein